MVIWHRCNSEQSGPRTTCLQRWRHSCLHWMAAAPKQGCVVSVIFLNICLIFKNEVSKYSEELAQIAKNIKNKVLMI